MSERELKFHIPESSRESLLQAVQAMQPEQQHLAARYYDTPDRELAKARIALRMRNENGQWVQTIKAPGADAVSREEFNHPSQDDALDIEVLKHTPQYKTLSLLKDRLHPFYETDVIRLAVKIKHQNSEIELALDRGALRANATELEIHELEFELVSGEISDLFRVAEQWQQQFGLILELGSKSERGNTLAGLMQQSDNPDLSQMISVRKASPIRYDASLNLNSAYQLCVNDCLQQIVRNTAGLAGIDSEKATHAQRIAMVHQLRVGIRRLRSCWKFFRSWLAIDASPEAAELRRYFSLFGEGRDQDIIWHEITPRLIADGMPSGPARPKEQDDPQRASNLAASAGLQTILLRLTEQSLATPKLSQQKAGKKSDSQAARILVRRLNKWLHQIAQAGTSFDTLTPEERHALRKKIKRLRYSFEFSQSLIEALRPEKTVTLLLDIQRTLGDLNDLYTTQAFYEDLTTKKQLAPSAWFALGWIRAMQATHIQQATALFLALEQAGPLEI